MDAPMPVRASRTFLLAGLIAMAGMPWQASVADGHDAVEPGTYSSLAFNEESDDLGGYEIEVLPTAKGIKLVLQIAEGELVDVVVADARLEGGRLSAAFDLRERPGCRLDAQVLASSLVVTFDFGKGATYTVTLDRSVGYWDRNVPK